MNFGSQLSEGFQVWFGFVDDLTVAECYGLMDSVGGLFFMALNFSFGGRFQLFLMGYSYFSR